MIGLHLQQAEAPVSGTHLIALPARTSRPTTSLPSRGVGHSRMR
ncbi:hypothetical protein [Brachybacterium sacelli]